MEVSPESQSDDQGPVGGSIEEEILKRYASRAEEFSEESSDASEEGDGEQDPLEEEIIRKYMSINEDQDPEPGEGKEAGLPSEEEIIETDTSDEAESDDVEGALEPIEEEPETETVPLEEEEASSDIESGVDTPSEVESTPEAVGPGASRPNLPSSPEEVMETLKALREDVGQISELGAEEGNIVMAFSLSLLKLMEPLTKTLPVDVSILPREMGGIERANVVPTGELVVLFEDGRMESVDLTEPKNRDLLVDVVSDVMSKFNDLIAEKRSKIEERITFLSEVTKELQTISDSLAAVGS
jgi:hypothetical protein